MQIRKGNANDLSDVRAVSDRATTSYIAKENLDDITATHLRNLTDAAVDAFANGVESVGHSVYVATRDDVFVGYVIAAHDAPEICWILVDPNEQGSGVAKALMIAALDALMEYGARGNVQLSVPVTNERAMAFYRKFGFMVTGPVKDQQLPMIEMQRAA